jgi:hypothetical protein
LTDGAPPGAAAVYERAVRGRRREYEAQLRLIEQLQADLAARKAGRVVKQLKARDGWRVIEKPGGAVEYAFQTPQVKGAHVVKAEAAQEHARRRLSEIAQPGYLSKPLMRAREVEAGAAGVIRLRIVHQVDGDEAVARAEDEPIPPVAGRSPPQPEGKIVYLTDFPARDWRPGMVLTDMAIDVIGPRTYQGDNGRTMTALHVKPVDWRKWIHQVKRAEGK